MTQRFDQPARALATAALLSGGLFMGGCPFECQNGNEVESHNDCIDCDSQHVGPNGLGNVPDCEGCCDNRISSPGPQMLCQDDCM